MIDRIQALLGESAAVKRAMAEETASAIAQAVETLVRCFRGGNKMLVCGNGGSAADAQHFAAEFVNRYKLQRDPLPVIALTTDSSVLTSVGNDSSFDEIFSKQVAALGRKGDVLLVITTSDVSLEPHGHSANIAQALRAARHLGLTTIGFVSQKSKKILEHLDLPLVVPHTETSRIQEAHITMIHIITELTEEHLFPQRA